jgi:hypothetical protein
VRRFLAVLVCVLAAACGRSKENSAPREETVLEVTSPVAGAELLAGEHPVIEVSGALSSEEPVEELEIWVNGEPVKVDGNGAFSASLTPNVGVNHIKVEGYDGRSDEPITREMDVLWAPGYVAPLPASTGFDLTGAIELRLGQQLFDARLLGTDLDLSPDPVVARDLASMVELVLWHVDLASLLAGSLQLGEGDTSLDITIPAVTPADVVVDAEVISDTEQGVDLFIDLTGVYLEMDGELAVAGNTWVVDGGIAADMYAFARVTVALTTAGVVATVSDASTAVGPLTPMFTGPDGAELNAFVTLGEHELRTLVETLVADELIPTFTNELPGLFEAVLGALDATLSEVTFELDSGLGEPVGVSLHGEAGGLDFAAGPPIGADPGHVTVRQDVSVRTTGTPLHPDSRGALQIDAVSGPPFSDGSGLNLAVRMDLVNALLHALWNDGLLEAEVDVIGTPALVSARLPPIVRDTPLELACYVGEERCDLILQIGQLEVEFPEDEQRFGVQMTVGARIHVGENEIALTLQEAPTLHVWEDTPITDEPGAYTPDFIEDLFANIVWPALAEGIANNLSIALPVPSLADLGLADSAPALASSTLQVTVQQAGVESGYLRLAADLTLEAPQP